jgi:hypothetical protein
LGELAAQVGGYDRQRPATDPGADPGLGLSRPPGGAPMQHDHRDQEREQRRARAYQ